MKYEIPPVDLIFITYGQREMCEANIENIMENTEYPQFNLTVIDNQSLDDTWQGVCRQLYKYEGSKGLQVHQNVGYGQACTLGSLVTNAPIMVFLNSDIRVKDGHEDWLHPLVDTLVDEKDVAVVGPKLVNRENLLMATGVRGTNKERYIGGWLKPDNGEYDTACDVLSICGAVFPVKREYYNMYGGFDPSFIHYFEEEDICWRFRHEGLRIKYQPESVLIHDHMGSCKDQQVLSGYAGEGQMIFEQKWKDWMDDPTMYPQNNEGE